MDKKEAKYQKRKNDAQRERILDAGRSHLVRMSQLAQMGLYIHKWNKYNILV